MLYKYDGKNTVLFFDEITHQRIGCAYTRNGITAISADDNATIANVEEMISAMSSTGEIVECHYDIGFKELLIIIDENI